MEIVMKKVGILVLALMASFGASAKPLTEAGLKNMLRTFVE